MEQNNFKSFSVLHKALLFGQIVFAAFALYLSYSGTFLPSLKEEDKTFQVIALIVCGTAIYLGITLFKRKLIQLRASQEPVQSKFIAYRTASIIQWALLEGACLFTIICFLLVGNYAFIALSATLIFFFTMLAPSKPKTAIHLLLTEEELAEL